MLQEHIFTLITVKSHSLFDTGLMSIGCLTKKAITKTRPEAIAEEKEREERKCALSPWSLTESSAESELSSLMHIEMACAG